MSVDSFTQNNGIDEGEKDIRWINVGSKPLGELKIPLWIAMGGDNSKMVAIVAGIHGCEYAGILAASRVFAELEPSNLHGTVAIIPVANPPAYSRRSRYVNPIDNLNLNRTFPGDMKGSMTQRIAFSIFKKVILHADYVIDLHGGDLFEHQLPHVKYFVTGDDKLDLSARELAMVFTEKFFHPISPEQIFTQGALFIEAAKKGIPSIIAEAGSEGKIEEGDVNFHYRGVLRTLQWLGILEGNYQSNKCKYEEVLNEIKLQSDHGGMFIPKVRVGQEVTESMVLAEIRDIRNNVVESVYSPISGIVRMLFTTGVINTGDPLMRLWKTQKTKEKA